jgi:DNA (cytosine-5)-methyltransferase 1
MLRAIREISPRWVVGENVRGLTNWNGGVVFDEVQADLEAEGYEVTPFLLPACGKDAPHRRDRIWFVAYSDKRNDGRNTGENEGEGEEERIQQRNEVRKPIESGEVFGTTPNPHICTARPSGKSGKTKGCGCRNNDEQKGRGATSEQHLGCSDVLRADTDTTGTRLERSARESLQGRSSRFTKQDWSRWPTESPICSRDDGISSQLDGITFPKWRNESIKAYGNAVVPQVVFEIYKAIEAYENRDTHQS